MIAREQPAVARIQWDCTTQRSAVDTVVDTLVISRAHPVQPASVVLCGGGGAERRCSAIPLGTSSSRADRASVAPQEDRRLSRLCPRVSRSEYPGDRCRRPWPMPARRWSLRRGTPRRGASVTRAAATYGRIEQVPALTARLYRHGRRSPGTDLGGVVRVLPRRPCGTRRRRALLAQGNDADPIVFVRVDLLTVSLGLGWRTTELSSIAEPEPKRGRWLEFDRGLRESPAFSGHYVVIVILEDRGDGF